MRESRKERLGKRVREESVKKEVERKWLGKKTKERERESRKDSERGKEKV